jgi:hypothetical protein
VVLLLAAAVAAALLAGGGDPTTDPAPTAPTAAPSPTPSPTPSTPQEQAAADLDALVRSFRAAEDRVYLDPALDPGQAFDPYLRWPASEEEVVRVLDWRRAGNTITSTSTQVHSVQVTALDLAADPATATVAECKTLTVAGTDGDGRAQSGTAPRQQVVWTAKALPDGTWRLYSATAQEDNSC